MEIRPILSALSRHKVASALVVLEIALSCAILCNAMFLIMHRLHDVRTPSGIAEDELVQIRIGNHEPRDNADARTREDLAALRAVPGVASAVVVNQVPFHEDLSNADLSLSPEQPVPTLSAALYQVNEGSLDALGLRLVAGRDFSADEYQDGSALFAIDDLRTLRTSVILSAAAAQALFPDQDPLGRIVYWGPIPLTVVGVVETLARPGRLYGNRTYSAILPVRLNYGNGGMYVLRVSDPGMRADVLARALAALERSGPGRLVLEQQSYAQARSDHFRNDRDMIGLLLSVCGLLLAVTALGIVGLASFWLQQRTKQIGVRRALGATRREVVRYFQTENFLLASIGIALGMVLAYAINQLLMGHYELPRLPLHYLPIGAAVLWLLGQLAVLGPALRAAAVPPAVATRSV